MKKLFMALALAPAMIAFGADKCPCGCGDAAACKCGATCDCKAEVASYQLVKETKVDPFLKHVAAFLEKNTALYLATVENGKPRVRPFRYTTILDNKLAITTSVKKGMSKQMAADGEVEIATATADGKMFARFQGKAVRCTDQAVLDAFLAKHPKFGKLFGADIALYLVEPENVGLFPNKPGAIPMTHKYAK